VTHFALKDLTEFFQDQSRYFVLTDGFHDDKVRLFWETKRPLSAFRLSLSQ
jgi:hypothetical protein